MIHAHGELVGVGDNLRRGGIGSRTQRASGLVRKWITGKERRNGRAHGNRQSVAGRSGGGGISGGVDTVAFRDSGHGEDLRGAEDLPETLILSEVKSAVPTVVDAGDYHRPAAGNAKLVAREWREAPRINGAGVIKIIARVERRIAHKFKSASMDLTGAGFGDHVVEPRSPVSDLCRHHARA